MYNIIAKRKTYFLISGTVILIGIVSYALYNLNFGIDFKGGTLWELRFQKEVQNQELAEFMRGFNLGEVRVRESEEGKMLKLRHLNAGERDEIFEKLKEHFGEVEETGYETVGPVIGGEIRDKAIIALVLSSLGIILYVAWAFRKVSKPVSSWRFGVTAIIALLHDLIIMFTVFVLLGKFLGVEINVYFITALLAVLGYSVNDTIVVFDRIRERLKAQVEEDFDVLVNKSINETLTRSLNTSITTLLVLFSIFLFGGESIRWFVFALIIGIVAGTYSSIFIASPLLVVWHSLGRRK